MPNVSVANAAAITKNINTDTATNTVTAITTITDTDATTVNMSSPKETIIKTLTERNSAYDDFECDAQEQQQADLQKPSTSDELQLPILSVYTLSRICTIDLTDDDDNNTYNRPPAPLPVFSIQEIVSTSKEIPPPPKLSVLQNQKHKVVQLTWNMDLNETHAEIIFYQIFIYEEVSSDHPSSDLWNVIGNLNALPLPMACLVSNILNGENYHFAIRAMDVFYRFGPFSSPVSITISF